MIDANNFRSALGKFATGVTVITTQTRQGKLEGLTVSSFAALSLEPPLVLWSIRRDAPSFASFAGAGAFAVNVLTAEQRDLARHFSTPLPTSSMELPARQAIAVARSYSRRSLSSNARPKGVWTAATMSSSSAASRAWRIAKARHSF